MKTCHPKEVPLPEAALFCHSLARQTRIYLKHRRRALAHWPHSRICRGAYVTGVQPWMSLGAEVCSMGACAEFKTSEDGICDKIGQVFCSNYFTDLGVCIFWLSLLITVWSAVELFTRRHTVSFRNSRHSIHFYNVQVAFYSLSEKPCSAGRCRVTALLAWRSAI